MRSLIVFTILALLASVTAAQAITWQVPGDALTIQAGLNLASPGDTVCVACGIYYENMIEMPSAVTLRSESGDPECVTIDAEEVLYGIRCMNGDANTRIEGLTITGGEYSQGGGLVLLNAKPAIVNCVLTGNSAPDGGGGAAGCFNGAAPTFIDCVIYSNSAVIGGAFWCMYESAITLIGCTLSGNASSFNSVIYMDSSQLTIENSIISYNEGVIFVQSSPIPSLSCSNIYGNEGGDWVDPIADQLGTNGNIAEDPRFCDAANGDFSLHVASPCRPEHSAPGCGLIGAREAACGVVFSAAGDELFGALRSSVAWGDYDNDGDLDILLAGRRSSGYGDSRVYCNDDGVFTDIEADLTGVSQGAAVWSDYDNDGDLDILLTGNGGSSFEARIYCNDAGTFIDIAAELVGVNDSAAAWGDYDNDGDLDLLLTGYHVEAGYEVIARIYRNDAGVFHDIEAGLTGVGWGSADWGDYDNDGDLDILLTGTAGSTRIARIYNNDNETFANIGAALTGVGAGSAAWGDYDNDGDLDILLTGMAGSSCISRIFNNDNGTFTNIEAELMGVWASAAVWGDYDNDGDMDVLLTGINSSGDMISRIYRNDAGAFTDIEAGLTGVGYSSVAWGDCDNDGDLDILYSGAQVDSGNYAPISGVYLAELASGNTPPCAPDGLSAIIEEQSIDLSWIPASDAQTPMPGLTYNLRIGTEPGGSDICSAMALPSGLRSLPQIGNAHHNTDWSLSRADLTLGTVYYWSVQALDTAFSGSAFAVVDSFSIPLAAVTDSDVIPEGFALHPVQPNPGRPAATVIVFDLPEACDVRLRLFDVAGRQVAALASGRHLAGRHAVLWDGEGATETGLYFCRLEAGEFKQVRKLLIAR